MKDRKLIAILFIIYGMIFNFIGGSLAYYNWETSEEQKTAVTFTTTENFSCSADGGGNITSADISLAPASCTNSDRAIIREIKINNKLNNQGLDVTMDLWLNVNILDSGLSNSTKFRYALTTEPDSCTEGVVLSGSFNGRQVNDKVRILNKKYTTSTEETYYLYIWLDKEETSLSTVGQNFGFSLGGECVNTTKTAYAVYSEDDNSLTFYKSEEPITVGSTYNGKTATAVYTGFESSNYDETTVPWYQYRANVESVTFEDTISPTSTAHWFRNFTNCINMDLSNLDTSKVTSMYYMFSGMSNLTELDVSSFNTSKVTNMARMFSDISKVTELDLGNFDTSSATKTYRMFLGMSSLTNLNISSLDTSNVTQMNNMFQNCSSLTSLDLSNFNTSKVTSMWEMFYNMDSITSLDLSSFDTSKVENMYAMFNNMDSITSLDISSFNTSNVTDMSWMFGYPTNLTNLNINSFNTSNVTSMNSMFEGLRSLQYLDVSSFNTSNVTNMKGMFREMHSITSLDLSGFDTSKVTNMTNMFDNSHELRNLKLNKATFSSVTSYEGIFNNIPSNVYIIVKDDTARNWLRTAKGSTTWGNIVTVAELH